ncbi:hypothetical protein [Paenibacillus silviterrae]|uniref:hypothetical protein n=1 Tax=Paenibacillus silviterrae TaxID=3242194 RepID=UPI002542D971|nr:hypothetical protein [Paenibacillus chinjuensis]
MNKHDKVRRDRLVRTLNKALKEADITLLYLQANERDQEDIMDTNLAKENIKIALRHLGADGGGNDSEN